MARSCSCVWHPLIGSIPQQPANQTRPCIQDVISSRPSPPTPTGALKGPRPPKVGGRGPHSLALVWGREWRGGIGRWEGRSEIKELYLWQMRKKKKKRIQVKNSLNSALIEASTPHNWATMITSNVLAAKTQGSLISHNVDSFDRRK